MASLTDTNINETYCSLIKTDNNAEVTGLTRLTDGLGNDISISVNTDNNGACVHGNLSFNTICGFTFPSDTGQSNKILTVDNNVIGIGDVVDCLSDKFTFTGGTSTFEPPASITINNKGVVTNIAEQTVKPGICSFTPAYFCCVGNIANFNGSVTQNAGIRFVNIGRYDNFNVNMDIKNVSCLGRLYGGTFATAAKNLADSHNFNFAILAIVNDKASPDSGNVNSYIAGRKWNGSSSYGVQYTIAGSESSGKGDRISYVNSTVVPICNNRYFNVCSACIGDEQVGIDLIGFA